MVTIPNPSPLRVLLAAPPGLLRNSILAYLRIHPGLQINCCGEDPISIPGIVTMDPPDVLIVDIRLLYDCYHAAQTDFWPAELNLICLIDNLIQKNQALAMGADSAFLKGLLDDRFIAAIITRKQQSQTLSKPLIEK